MQKMINDKHSEADFHFSKLDSYIGEPDAERKYIGYLYWIRTK